MGTVSRALVSHKMLSLLVLLTVFNIGQTYKILVITDPMGFSHMQFMSRIADILQEEGHDVTILEPDWTAKNAPSLSKSTKQVLFKLPEDIREGLDLKNLEVWQGGSRSLLHQIRIFSYTMSQQVQLCDMLLGENKIIEELKSQNFDVGITTILAPCGSGLFEKIGIENVIGTSAVGLVDEVAEFYDAPRLPSFKIGIENVIGTSAVGLVDEVAEFYDAPRLPSFVP
ncbi:unnamed protein product [Strongylus vulgaris]|uniref:glucuronosyltransferase n=1 Tax=Strongylus vulgaris TaxID=40348 RepID=A0A3P7JWR4_STRVU|nr:unnamed protein product [Strongylus vulgaris]